MADEQKPVTVPVSGQRFKDGTPVTPEQWENDSSQAAMDRAEAIDDSELDREIEILDELREHPERAEELSKEGGISYPND